MTEDILPVLYILMRNDLNSMNPGKGMAQASHASNAFWKEVNERLFADTIAPEDVENARLANIWQMDTNQGFGTVLVLSVNEAQMDAAVRVAKVCGYVAGVVHDPTYPVPDGAVVHYLPMNTCAYVFGNKNDFMLQHIVGKFPLHL